MRRTIVIVFFCLLAVGALAGLVYIDEDLGQTEQSTYTFRDYIFDDIVFTADQNFNDASKGDVAIYARSITIPSGVTISARGTGALGGGGGGGGGGRDGWDGVGDGGTGGYRGNTAYPPYTWGTNGNDGAYGGSWGNGGKGGGGGLGQTFDSHRDAPGYPYSEVVYKGNGGHGGAGGRGGSGESWSHHDEEGAGGGGGGGGGRGGGSVSLFAANRIFVGGKITSEGGAGGAGGSKGGRTKGILRYGGPGGNGGTSGQAGGSGGKGYAGSMRGEEDGLPGSQGSPGDILLACYSGDVEVHGALCANTVKVFYGGVYKNTSGGAGGTTVWTNTYRVPTAWGYSNAPSFLPIPVLYTNQPACTTTATVSGNKYIVVAKYTNTFSLFSADDVSSASGRGNGVTDVTFVTALRFEVPVESGATSTEEFTSGVRYASSYTNGIKHSGTPSAVAGRWWYMTSRNSSGWTYEQFSTPPSPVYYYPSGVAVRGTNVGQSVCATKRVVDTTTNFGPSKITVSVNNSSPYSATVSALPNFWLFPPTMLRYDDSTVTAWSNTVKVITNEWKVGTNYIKEMNGERPRQSWQSNSTREWPMPNQESGWQ